jgi:hypothetical protein
MKRQFAAAATLVFALALAGCGSSSSSPSKSSSSPATGTAPITKTSPIPPGPPAAVNELPSAEHPVQTQFPSVDGRSLRQLASLVHSSAALGPATGVFTPGTGRYAFAINEKSGAFVYAPTALYIAKSPDAPVKGPYLAPADPMGVAPQYRSKQNTGPGGIQAIYAAQLPLPHAGTYDVLALTHAKTGLIGSPGTVAVAASSPIPSIGDTPPAIATDTTGPIAQLTTRLPPEAMHSVSFSQVLGHKPVALLISTPQLCTSRVCGPVTDVLVSLQKEFQSKVAFIHQEVYVDNDPHKGLRPQLKAFHLETEPWLFVINRKGVIVDRFEGAFGVNEAQAALAKVAAQ